MELIILNTDSLNADVCDSLNQLDAWAGCVDKSQHYEFHARYKGTVRHVDVSEMYRKNFCHMLCYVVASIQKIVQEDAWSEGDNLSNIDSFFIDYLRSV